MNESNAVVGTLALGLKDHANGNGQTPMCLNAKRPGLELEAERFRALLLGNFLNPAASIGLPAVEDGNDLQPVAAVTTGINAQLGELIFSEGESTLPMVWNNEDDLLSKESLALPVGPLVPTGLVAPEVKPEISVNSLQPNSSMQRQVEILPPSEVFMKFESSLNDLVQSTGQMNRDMCAQVWLQSPALDNTLLQVNWSVTLMQLQVVSASQDTRQWLNQYGRRLSDTVSQRLGCQVTLAVEGDVADRVEGTLAGDFV